MPFTYDPSQLATNDVYRIRFELSDTDESTAFLDDDEIAYALTVESGFWGASARCAESISRRLLAKADTRLGRYLQLQYSTAAQQYAEMAKSLRAKALGAVVPYVGGTSVAAKVTAGADTDAVQPIFTKRGGDDPRTGGLSNDDTDQQPSSGIFHP